MKREHIQKATAPSAAWLLTLALGAPASAQTSAQVSAGVPGQSPSKSRVQKRETALGLTRIDLGNGQFEFQLPPGLVTEPEVREGAMTWIYEGQQVYSKNPTPSEPKWVYIEGENQDDRADDRFEGTVKVDEFGRRWVLAEADWSGMQSLLAEYNAEVEAEVGLEVLEPSAGALEAEDRKAREDVGTWALVTPLTWLSSDCDGDGEDDVSRWDSDGRRTSSNGMTIRQRKAVLIEALDENGDYLYHGTGTMVNGRWLVTAAHVVTEDDGTWLPASCFVVSTYGNYQFAAQTFDVSDLIVSHGYSGSGDISEDYAIMQLDRSAGVGWMPISQASNSTIRGADSYHIGYPQFRPNCSTNLRTRMDPSTIAKEQYWQRSRIFGTTSKRVKTYHDVGGGESGGPFYYYPGGCCGAHYLTGVISAFVNPVFGSSYNGGPKGSAIRTWVTIFTR